MTLGSAHRSTFVSLKSSCMRTDQIQFRTAGKQSKYIQRRDEFRRSITAIADLKGICGADTPELNYRLGTSVHLLSLK